MSMTRASLWHYRGLHALVATGVAVAVAVLAGALLVGSSVRASLRDLALQRLGAADIAISTATSFNARMSAAMVLAAPDTVRQTVSLIASEGTVTHTPSGRVAARVQVYGVDDAFWSFHGVAAVPLSSRDAALSESLARELGAANGDALVLRVSGPSEIPLGTLQGRRDDGGARIRVTVSRTLDAARMGEFSLLPGQAPVAAVFVPLGVLQRELKLPGRANTILVQHTPRDGSADPSRAPVDAVQRAWLASAALPDHGLRIRRVPGDRVMALEGLGGFISPDVVERVQAALARLQRPGVPALTYVATAIRSGDRATPYSTVTAIDIDAYSRLSVPTGPPDPDAEIDGDGDPLVRGSLEVRVGTGGVRVGRMQVTEAERRPPSGTGRARPPDRAPNDAEVPRDGVVWLNQWTADDLDARIGDTVHLDYFVWTDEGGLDTRSASFSLQGILPMMRIGGDRTLTPDYPGITDAPDLTAWDPPFPVDLSRVRPKDEAYWDQWRAAPKAFVPIDTGQRLWGSRFGNVSSIRFAVRDADAVAAAVRAEMNSQIVVRPVRADALAAARGTTDFGEYFLYFSFFLVVSALLIAYLFFALSVEQRAQEAGLLAAVGFAPGQVRGVFLREALVVTGVGVALGLAGAVGYAWLIMHGLRTWWVDAVGTTALRLHVEPLALAAGAIGAAAAALLALWLGTRALARRSPRALLLGAAPPPSAAGARGALSGAILFGLIAAGLLAATQVGAIGSTGGFFGAGGALLVGGLLLSRAILLGRGLSGAATTRRFSSVWGLGQSHTAWRPARTVLTLSLIAFATFVLVSVVAFRRDGAAESLQRTAGTGGFALLAESAVPLMHDPNTTAGRLALGLDAPEASWPGTAFTRLRLRPGDEASCLTLYQPRNPRIVGVSPESMAGRFTFAGAAAVAPGETPWSLLDRPADDGTIPAIADQTTLTYVFHLKVGDVFEFAPDGVTPVFFRIVAALADSVLQSELIIGERDFVQLFPRQEGYRVWLIETPEDGADQMATMLEDRLADSGVDVTDTRVRLAAYHRVENTYLATFQALGGLGLLLGTLGVGAVLARNVLERRREWGLLRAVGYQPGHLSAMVMAESAALVAGGVLIGSAAAAVAIAPAVMERGQSLPLLALAGVLGAVVLAGLLSSLFALRLATRTPVVTALKSE